MGKDTHLVNIYLKIHNKRALTMDDLSYLARYAPDCFEKTCKNVVYNIPEAKPIMEPEETVPVNGEAEPMLLPAVVPNIERVLENLKRLEADDFPAVNVDSEHVKSLLGNLYMEMLFPHNDRDTFFNTTDSGRSSGFDARI